MTTIRHCLILAAALTAATGLAGGCRVEKVTPDQSAIATETGSDEVTATEAISTKLGIAMRSIPGGAFTMGNDRGEEDERPAHAVSITAFHMDTYEVTQKSYEALMGTNPSKYKNPDQPVEQLGWYGAIKYCNMRSLREELTPCYDLDTMACNFDADGYRLPTEAEWEWAARAGTTSEYAFDGGENALSAAAWYAANAGETPQPVGGKAPNPWGLHDIYGNVYEWCNDVYGESYYAESPSADPCNYGEGEERVLRGGGWDSGPEMCRSSARYSEAPGFADVCFGYDEYGFRCVRRATSP